MNTAIKVSHLTKIYKLYDKPVDRLKESLHPLKKQYHKEFYALNDVSFEIKKGETVGIIGKNGAGKSTLLKIITGVLTPSSGSVHVNGRIASLLELGAGFNPEYTGVENIYFQGSLMGYTREEVAQKVDEIIAFADIGDFVYQPVKMYSSGMYARLAFAVAINVDPDILIVDEALSVGDMAFQAKCFNKFKEFQRLNKTILFVTHSIDLIIKYCQSAILINNGKKLLQGDTKSTTEMFRKIMVSTLPKEIQENEEIQINTIKNTNSYDLKLQLPLNPSANIYGSMEAEIIDFAIFGEKKKITNHLRHDEDYTIFMTVKFNQDIIDPIFAYTFKSVDGMELTGTNSNNLNEVFGKIQAGEIITIEFTQKMILNSGSYFLALGCTKYENDNLKVFHRIYDAVAVDVVSPTLSTGIAFSCTKLKYERINDKI
ncbi:ABC transporter ATP-binding protein [Sulfurospirillum sp. MES]|uniref:ABC transporter ATP-binding protein n=1 Tax=Sulfurospirillum sp. MES TaxID=1565314 RepID=UPI00054439C4|nr:ABC transporter ATP-binding protein [Sulfurospirillum sp. MES]KHG32921.1 MAG: ABC transporter [Sulfurospirillum sp. MES]